MQKDESMKSDLQKERIDQGLEKYRKQMVGAVLSPQRGNESATKDAIRHFANGVGDRNPLWIDEEYAGRSPYKGILAPPLFLNAVSEGQAIVGLPGLIATFVGAEWEWHKEIRVNDSFTVTNELLDLNDLGAQKGEYRFLQKGILRYVNQKRELVGTCLWSMMRSRAKLGGIRKSAKKKSPEIRIYHYAEEELAAIYEGIEAEQVRGAAPRYWEDVQIGEPIQPVIKGPLSLSDMVAWAMGIAWHRIGLAHGPKLIGLRRTPGLSYQDPDTGTPEPIANSHFLPSAAKILMGSPLPMDLGFQRVCWLGHAITNWMSDWGFLRQLSAVLKGFVRFGDTNWCGGTVVKKWIEKENRLVEIDLSCKNQCGEITTTGKAVVALPYNEAQHASSPHS